MPKIVVGSNLRALKMVQKLKGAAAGRVWSALHECEGKLVRAVGLVKRMTKGGKRGNKAPKGQKTV